MALIDVRFLCEKLYHLPSRDGYYFSPVRNDGQNPAFAIRPDGEVGIDHGTNEGFNALTLIAKVENLTLEEARRRIIFYAEQEGSSLPPHSGTSNVVERVRPDPSWKCVPQTRTWPTLHAGTPDNYSSFAKLRGLHPAALMVAHALGLFFFIEKYARLLGYCTITDNARYARQDRCMHGFEMPLKHGGTTKNRTIGTASWPVGSANIGHKPVVLLVEGMPDLLAATQVILEAGRLHEAAPVAMLGAGQHINVHALPHFAGKHVRIFPDQDDAGAKGAATWAGQLQGIAASVDFFSFDTFPLPAQKPIKDLNDFVAAGGMAVCKHMIPSIGGKGSSYGNQ